MKTKIITKRKFCFCGEMNLGVITTAPAAGKPLPKASHGLEENLQLWGATSSTKGL